MKEIKYQIKYINKLANTAKELLTDGYRDSGSIIFKAPTGSGKTYMVSQALTQMVKDNPKIDFAFTLNPQLHSRSATYIKRNGLLIRKITIKSSRPFQCAYHPLTP